MSAGPTDKERISALEEGRAEHAREIGALREKSHRQAGSIQTLLNWDLPPRMTALETFKNRLVGIAIGLGFASGVIGALIVKLIER